MWSPESVRKYGCAHALYHYSPRDGDGLILPPATFTAEELDPRGRWVGLEVLLRARNRERKDAKR